MRMINRKAKVYCTQENIIIIRQTSVKNIIEGYFLDNITDFCW